MSLSHKRFILGLFTLLFSVALAAPPLWWSDGDPPVVNENEENNHGPANIGQAKHVVKSALDALRVTHPSVTADIEQDLAPIINLTVPDPKTDEWIQQQNAPLLIGQLKAISAPFYTRLNTEDPVWLAAELTENGTSHPGSIFPWTVETTDDANKGIANIGQLKAVFSLRFENLENSTGGNSTGGGSNGGNDDIDDIDDIDPNDLDNDGLTNEEEALIGTNPELSDSDGDGINDGEDGWALSSALSPVRLPKPNYIVMPLKQLGGEETIYGTPKINNNGHVAMETATGSSHNDRVYYADYFNGNELISLPPTDNNNLGETQLSEDNHFMRGSGLMSIRSSFENNTIDSTFFEDGYFEIYKNGELLVQSNDANMFNFVHTNGPQEYNDF